MRLVFLYGPPGVGKLSVGSELFALTGFKLFHNHLTVDLVTSIFPRESDVWVRLIRKFRQDVFTEAACEGVDLLFTYALRSSSQHDTVRAMIDPIQSTGGSVLFVQLACARNELLSRVQTDARRARGKLTDPRALTDRYDLSAALPFDPHLRIDTTRLSAKETAAQIAAHYSLPLRAVHSP